jgi:hypothetical protein
LRRTDRLHRNIEATREKCLSDLITLPFKICRAFKMLERTPPACPVMATQGFAALFALLKDLL